MIFPDRRAESHIGPHRLQRIECDTVFPVSAWLQPPCFNSWKEKEIGSRRESDFLSDGAGYGSRTRLASLGSWSNTDIPTLHQQMALYHNIFPLSIINFRHLLLFCRCRKFINNVLLTLEHILGEVLFRQGCYRAGQHQQCNQVRYRHQTVQRVRNVPHQCAGSHCTHNAHQ